MTKWLPTLTVLFGGALTAITPQIQSYLGQYPAITAIAVALVGAFLHIAQSPVQK